jgi:hypothetical protein
MKIDAAKVPNVPPYEKISNIFILQVFFFVSQVVFIYI